jgi:hypothetical protein
VTETEPTTTTISNVDLCDVCDKRRHEHDGNQLCAQTAEATPPSEGARNTAERLADRAQRDAFFAAIVEQGSVNKAAKALSLNRSTIYLLAQRDETFGDELLAAEATNLRKLVDDTQTIANEAANKVESCDDPKRAGAIVQAARLRIDTLLRLAGKLIPAIYGDKPAETHVNVGVQVNTVSDEKQRARLITMREEAARELGGPTRHLPVAEEQHVTLTESDMEIMSDTMGG